MPFTEPGTTITDFLMGAQALFYACLLYMIGRRHTSVLLWSVAMLDVAAAAILGGTHHGFNHDNQISPLLWSITIFLFAYLSLFMSCGAVLSSIRNPARRFFIVIFALKFLGFLLYLGTRSQLEFGHISWDYIPALLMVLLFKLYSKYARNDPSSNWIIAGVLVSLFALPVQASGFEVNEWVDHNSVFHVIQMIALHCYYNGARYMKDL
ncbi:MAG: hypothetical protein HOD72_03030 [Opitutae bacterium]|jgi:hypothetical protein|nr:hypothetical protein [Opitutae bacterium]MBT5379244.1 hypothetical protein [Opitutae bacterium]MBT5690416.1 hypothetical protein [Opitutae bacterium]MBT6461165.1 hypothetical protein [Opitutae bacterium]MBT7852687.1 hypothetical protein [Opitutae bacterium]